jgi:electron transfer flavoprotein beta subunit
MLRSLKSTKVLQKFRRSLSLHQFWVNKNKEEENMAFKVLVCAKQVPNTNEIKINPETGTLIRDGVESILNHDDANALEEALALKDKYDDVEVIVVTMGPPQAKDMLLECLAKGADEAILLSDRAVGGSDTWATSNAVTAAIKKYGEFDLIFAGRQAIDGDTAQVGPQIAEKLDLPQVTYVQKFEISEDRKTVTVERKLEDGYEVIEVPVPCMLTAIKELNNPRYMSISGIYSAKDKPLHVWNAADVAVDLNTVGLKASPTNVFRSFTPKPKEPGHMVAGDTDKDLAKNLLIELKGKHVI